MSWTTPKTNWIATDTFNFSDFNRIKNNISVIYMMCRTVFNTTYNIDDMGEDVTSYADVPSVTYFNAIENNLDTINENSYILDIGDKATFYANGLFPDFTELNRIESATLAIYEEVKGVYDSLPRLSFVLGTYREMQM